MPIYEYRGAACGHKLEALQKFTEAPLSDCPVCGKSSLSKGDLVFFATRGGSRVGHVGIYVGSGKFIHASSGGGRVRVDSLNEGYYKRRYVGARRVKGKTTVASRHSSRAGRTVAKKDAPKTVASKTSEPNKGSETKEVAAPTPPNTRGADDIIK